MTVQMPVSLHQRIAQQAEREGVSVNQMGDRSPGGLMRYGGSLPTLPWRM